MKRRNFVGGFGLAILTGSTGLSQTQQPATGLNFTVDVPDADPKDIEVLVIDITDIEIRPKYLDEKEEISIQAEVDIEGNKYKSDEHDVKYNNGDTTVVDWLEPILIEDPPNDKEFLSIEVTVFIEHKDISERHTQVFTLSQGNYSKIVYEEDFSTGLADWVDRGHIWSGGEYSPMSYDNSNNRLRMRGADPSARGISHPTEVDENINNWQLEFSVSIDTGSSHHQYRDIGGFMSGETVDNYDNRATPTYGVWFEDRGDTVVIRAHDGSNQVTTGKSYNPSQFSGISDINDGVWNYKVRSSKTDNSLLIKIWEDSAEEPSDWTFKFDDRHIPGRPGFYNNGEYHADRYAWYNEYILKV